jgi:hypothetical protein
VKTLAIVGGLLAIIGGVTFNQFNRRLEAACALPVTPQPTFRRIPLPLELAYVTVGLTASVARTIRKALA